MVADNTHMENKEELKSYRECKYCHGTNFEKDFDQFGDKFFDLCDACEYRRKKEKKQEKA